MRSFHGKGKRTSYFEGWYLKQQNESETVALIPAYHIDSAGKASASLQVITDEGEWHLDFPAHAFSAEPDRFRVRMGDCTFTEQGCELQWAGQDCTLDGSLRFGPFTPLAKDIMGPFRFMPLMECRHSVFSLNHRVDGEMRLNSKAFCFKNGAGYMEGDRGNSFPKRYVWTQCGWDGNCIMLSVADIPLAKTSFTGCIGLIYLNGRQHRIATYLGARLLHISDDMAVVRQGSLTLTVKLIKARPHMLRAPDAGHMTRLIRESPSCRVEYLCTLGRQTLCHLVSDRAGFEGNWAMAQRH